MINIISRSLIFKKISGPQKVVNNLIKGLDKLGYPYVINKRLDYCKRLYVHDDRLALAEIAKLDSNIKVLVGPNLYVLPRDIPKEINILKAVYLVPSEWNKRFWLHFGFNKCSMESWATGIDTEEFRPMNEKKDFVLLYFKQRFDSELQQVVSVLKNKKINYKFLHYDKGYQENDFKELLKKTRYAIWLGRQESQGIALEEVLSSNIPILICDVSSLGHLIGGGEFNQAEKDFADVTSAEYFDERCGIKIKDLKELDKALNQMESKLDKFRSREYILENLSLEGQAKKLLSFYEKYFKLSYDAGFQEKPLNYGDWKNAKWYYILYLKFKHIVKIGLIKLGIWKLLKG